MKTDKIMAVAGTAAAAVLTFALAAQASAQTKAEKPTQAASATTNVPMPKTDRMAMAEFKKLLATGDVVVIDVRSNDAYAGGHIPGALSMPEETLNNVAAEKLKRLGKVIATYCS